MGLHPLTNRWLAGSVGLALLSPSVPAQFLDDWPPGGLDVHFVPTPQPVVDEMLSLADVNENDVVYDLGSGDGRIVITAAERFGATGVGIDLDPVRVEEGRENAAEAGVADKVRFIEGDLFEADLSEASVVTIYLLGSLNERLRPKLLEELRPGTRVVSHAFDMGAWEPDATSDVEGTSVYLWVIPADAEGRWDVSVQRPDGEQQFSLALDQTFQILDGDAVIDGSQVQVEEGSVQGERLELNLNPLDESGNSVQQRMEGQINGDFIQGWVFEGDGQTPVAQWRATRESGNGEQEQLRAGDGD